jgi:putative flippase GtrA
MKQKVSRAAMAQAMRFIVVGVINTLVDTGIYLALTRETALFSDALVAAKLISFLFATLTSFFLNRGWTFSVRTRLSLREVARFYASVSLGLLINVGTLYVCVRMFGIYDLIALGIATLFTFASNFVLSKMWVFRQRPERAPELARL